MAGSTWVLATDDRKLTAMVRTARAGGAPVAVLAVGPRALADAAAAARPDHVSWIEPRDGVPPEAYAATVADILVTAQARVVVATPALPTRVLLGAAIAALGAAVVPGVQTLAIDGETVLVDRVDLGGRVREILAPAGPVAALFAGPDVATGPDAASSAEPLVESSTGLAEADVRIEKSEPVASADGGLTQATRVVAVGRGLKAQTDLRMVEELAEVLGAAVGCSMPIADDFGWIPQERYIGRSGQHVAPRLYVAIGISGAPQHLDGVRDAKTVVAVNNDPAARIFTRADYGILGDLYEVLPELRAALLEDRSQQQGRGEES